MTSKCLSLPPIEANYVRCTAQRTGLPYAGVVRRALSMLDQPMPAAGQSWRFTVRLPYGDVRPSQIVAAIRQQMVDDAASGLANELGLGQEQHQTIKTYLQAWFSPASEQDSSPKGSGEQRCEET